MKFQKVYLRHKTRMFISCLIVFKLFAYQTTPLENLKLTSYTIQEGLSQNAVYAILQDYKGFLWIGTKDGLNRFDGYTFKHYNKELKDNDISDNVIKTIFEDSKKNLWIGTENGGLNLYNRKFDIFRKIIMNNLDLKDLTIAKITSDSNGNLWLCALEEGLIKYDLSKNTFTKANLESRSNVQFPHKKIKTIFMDKDDILWVGFSDNIGLARVDLKTNQFRFFKQDFITSEEGKKNHINTIFKSKSNDLWIGTLIGLGKFSEATKTFLFYPLNKGKESTNIYSIVEDKLGNLWLATTQYGLFQFNPKKEKFSVHKVDNYDVPFEDQVGIETLFIDKGGLIWLGLNGFGLKNSQYQKK